MIWSHLDLSQWFSFKSSKTGELFPPSHPLLITAIISFRSCTYLEATECLLHFCRCLPLSKVLYEKLIAYFSVIEIASSCSVLFSYLIALWHSSLCHDVNIPCVKLLYVVSRKHYISLGDLRWTWICQITHGPSGLCVDNWPGNNGNNSSVPHCLTVSCSVSFIS